MKTTLNIDESLLKEAMNSWNFHYKTEAIEEGLRELIAKKKREQLADLFGTDKTGKLQIPRRRR
jgi:hypothetical protein